MSGRPKRRGRPPKTPGSEKPKFQMHLLKKPKYLQNVAAETSQSEATAAALPAAATTTGRSTTSRRSASASVRGGSSTPAATPSRSTRRSVATPKAKTPKTPAASVAPKPKTARPSTSKKSKKSAAVHEKAHDYHYGSDFEESEKSDDLTDSEQSDTNVEDADEVSDSDFSVSGFSVASRARKSNVSYIRNPSPEPLWLRGEEIPKLELPKSSEDLLMPNEHVMQALCVYEVLRRFKSQVNCISIN